MKMDERYQALRSEIETGLATAQHSGVPFEDAIGDLIRLGLTLAVAFHGPKRAETIIANHIAHMRRTWPDLYKADAAMPEAQGNA